jgi:hypothetical protein
MAPPTTTPQESIRTRRLVACCNTHGTPGSGVKENRDKYRISLINNDVGSVSTTERRLAFPMTTSVTGAVNATAIIPLKIGARNGWNNGARKRAATNAPNA